jgi:hypothetical protein
MNLIFEGAMSNKEQRVWQYVLANRKATVREIAEACDVEPAFVAHLLSKIGTPETEWRNADNGPGAWDALYEAENEDILAAGYPDNNPKTALGEAKPKISSTPTVGIREMGKVFELGAKKYGRYNWRLHQVSATVYYDAAWRHLSAWFDGEDLDPGKRGVAPSPCHGLHDDPHGCREARDAERQPAGRKRCLTHHVTATGPG